MKAEINEESIKWDEVLKFFNDLGIKTEIININENGFSREILFTIYNIEYVIEWWVNISYLKIGNHNRAAKYPFKHILLNTTYPLVGKNECISFIPKLLEKKSIFEIGHEFEVLYIPTEIL